MAKPDRDNSEPDRRPSRKRRSDRCTASRSKHTCGTAVLVYPETKIEDTSPILLPIEFHARLDELFAEYKKACIEFHSNTSVPAPGSVWQVHGNTYEQQYLIHHDAREGLHVVAKDGETFLLQQYADVRRAADHVARSKSLAEHGYPIVAVVEHDLRNGRLILEGRIGVPFIFLFFGGANLLSQLEAEVVNEFYCVFANRYVLPNIVCGEIEIDTSTPNHYDPMIELHTGELILSRPPC